LSHRDENFAKIWKNPTGFYAIPGRFFTNNAFGIMTEIMPERFIP
jgi:hypothetical protein